MKRLVIGGLAVLAIGLSGCAQAAEAQEPEKQPGKPVSIDWAEVVVHPAPAAKTSCIMLIPGSWTCPEGVAAP